MRRVNLLWFLILLVTASCEKEVVTIIHEPEKVPADSVKPSSFELFIDEVTDTRINIHWTKAVDETSNVSYDVLVGDSVVAFGSSLQCQYLIENLTPDTEYSISVMALDQERNSFTVTKKATTKKSFFNRILSFNPDFYSYRFDIVISTNDGGLLICGKYLENVYSGLVRFLMRLDPDFNIVWNKENISEVSDIKLISSGCFLITGSNYVAKIDGQGNELWKCPVELESGKLATAIENSSGQVMIIGNWWSTAAVTIEYYIAQVSETGTLMWQKRGAPTKSNFFNDIIQKPDGGYLVVGTHDAIRSEWLVETDEQGNITRESDYISSFRDRDLPSRIIRWIGGNYLLAGSTFGCLPPYYFVNIIPRFILVSPEGSIIWDKTLSIASGTDEYFRNYAIEEDNSILFLSSTYEQSAFAQLDQNGNVLNKIVLSDLPGCIFLKKDGLGNYVLTLSGGYIVLINKDGYMGP